jgi:predicted nucleic acid-binding protein
MLAPSLWIYEIANALVMANRRGRIVDDQSRLALRLLQGVGVRLVDPEPEECLQTAARLGISAYDAAYVALAHATRSVLWTGDRRLSEKVRQEPGLVRWIGSFGLES